MSEYMWLEELDNCEELSQKLGIQVLSMKKGDIVVGYEPELDEHGNQIPILRKGIVLELSGETPDVLDKIDLKLQDLKREGGRDFRAAVSSNLDISLVNPQKESYKLSRFYGLTHNQLDTYIDNNVTDLHSAKEFARKMAHVMLWLVKQTRLDE